MEALVLGAVFIGGGVLGYWLASHIHAVADKAAQTVKDVADKATQAAKDAASKVS